jgi:hypothetical protein
VVGAEQRLRPLDRDRLKRVDELLALVVAAPGVPLGVLVRQHRAAGFKHGERYVVLRRDQPELVGLAVCLVVDQARDLRVFGVNIRDGRLVHQGGPPCPHEAINQRQNLRYLRLVSTPIILDCDPGVDDALAIAFAAGSPEIDLIGLTSVAGNVELAKTTANALAVASFVGAKDVPVTPGRARRCCARRTPRETSTATPAWAARSCRRPRGRRKTGTRSTTSSTPSAPRAGRSRWSPRAR